MTSNMMQNPAVRASFDSLNCRGPQVENNMHLVFPSMASMLLHFESGFPPASSSLLPLFALLNVPLLPDLVAQSSRYG